jgi:hypothetical protein
MRMAILSALGLTVLGAGSKQAAPAACVPVLPGWTSEQTGKPADVAANVVSVRGTQIFWNGYPTDEQTVGNMIEEVARMNPQPFTVFDPAQASDCALARRIRDTLDRQLSCSERGCWQGSKHAFDRAPYKTPNSSVVP